MKIDTKVASDMKVAPNRILDTGWGFAKSRTLATAVELDIFTQIANGKHSVEEIAKALGTSLRGMEMLLNALVGLQLLTKDSKGACSLPPDSEKFLVSGREGYLGSMCMHTAYLSQVWSHLTESVKTGKPYMHLDERKEAEDFFPDLVKALFNLNYQASRYAASYLKRSGKQISDILDVGAGSCVWGIGFAQEFQGSKLTAIDFPSVCNIARAHVKDFGLTDRFDCIEGDLREIDFGALRYDLIILGNICHSEGRANTEKLLKKSHAALKMGGSLLIAEFLPNDDKTGPAMPLLFALNMLVNTNEGDVFTVGEFRRWLIADGFKNIEILTEAPSQSPLILATK